MKERPLLFSVSMARASRDESKTQTRRIVNPQPKGDFLGVSIGNKTQTLSAFFSNGAWPCPYGRPGDLLWVREEHYCWGHWEPVDGVKTKGGKQKWQFVPDAGGCSFDPPSTFRKGRYSADPETKAWHKRLARFMPSKFSRTILEITNVRVERLQDISESDAMAEGIHEFKCPQMSYFHSRKEAPTEDHFLTPGMAYMDLWNSINGLEAWSANPYVWVVEFKKIKPQTTLAGH